MNLAVHLDRDGPHPAQLEDHGQQGLRRRPLGQRLGRELHSTIENELVNRRTFATRDQARLALFRYIESFYNPLRRHTSLSILSPK